MTSNFARSSFADEHAASRLDPRRFVPTIGALHASRRSRARDLQSERNGTGVGGKLGRILDAVVDLDTAIVRKYVERYGVLLAALLVVYIVLTLCIGTIFLHVGHSYTSILGRAGCMSYVAGFLTFMSIGGFPSFVEDMKVFCRERLNGHYGVGAFVIGNSLSSIPFLFLIFIISGSIVYFMVGLHPGLEHFVYFV